MQRDDKGSGTRARDVEVNVGASILWNIGLLDDALLLQFLVGELVRAKNLDGLAALARAIRLASDVVQVALVSLELTHEVCIVITNGAENLLEFLALNQDLVLERAEMEEFLFNLVTKQSEAVFTINDAQLLELVQNFSFLFLSKSVVK